MPEWTREHLEKIYREGGNFRGLKFHSVDFSGMDLSRADFRSASCPYANFSKANCSYINAEGANFTLTKWDGANLHRANLKDAQLCDADMSGVTDFFGVTVTMECRTWRGLKLPTGFWLGFLFYGLLMEPPSAEWRENLEKFFGAEHYKVLHDLYVRRQM